MTSCLLNCVALEYYVQRAKYENTNRQMQQIIERDSLLSFLKMCDCVKCVTCAYRQIKRMKTLEVNRTKE